MKTNPFVLAGIVAATVLASSTPGAAADDSPAGVRRTLRYQTPFKRPIEHKRYSSERLVAIHSCFVRPHRKIRPSECLE
jgi:hypothetical protein